MEKGGPSFPTDLKRKLTREEGTRGGNQVEFKEGERLIDGDRTKGVIQYGTMGG